nr:hypothetical protein [Tanacetum cinerariifolium]
MCDKENSVLFTDTECVVLSSDYKLPDENHVLLRVPRENNMYNVDLRNVVPSGDLTCLFEKYILDVFNLWHRRLGHINFQTMNKLVKGIRPKWLFDIDTLTQSMNYQPVVAGNQPNHNACIKENLDAGKVRKETIYAQQYVLLPLWSTGSQDPLNTYVDVANAAFDVKETENEVPVSPSGSDKTKKHDDKAKRDDKGKSHVDPSIYPDDPDMPELEDIVYLDDKEDVGADADLSNLERNISGNLIPTTRVHKDHRVTQIIGDLNSTPQTRSMARMGKRAIGSKWVFRNKKDKRGIVIKSETRLVAQGHTQEEGIDYDEVFALVARIEAIRLFLAYASFMGFMENGFQRGKIDQTLFIKKQKGDNLLVHVYVDNIIFGSTNKELHKAFEKLMKDKFQMSSMGELTFFLGLQVKKKDDGIFISQDKYVAKILRKFGFINVKSASTPIEIEKPLLKAPDGEDVDVHIYRSMIDSMMYITSSRPDIMFSVCACDGFQVTPKVSHLHVVIRIFRYLKGKPHLGLWYPRDSPFNLVAYSDSDYAGASLDRNSKTGGCQFLGCRLISWQCKKQTIVATSSTEAEYVAAASCCAQYALMVNRTIYVSCIKQFWDTVNIKKANDVVQLRALIDGKKVVVTKDVIRQDLYLDDADGFECFANEEIFTELAHMVYEKPPPKLTFYKANMDNPSKFRMYPWFLHVIINTQVDDLTCHNTKYTSPALTPKVFTNMRRVGKGFSGVETPLFASMLVAIEEGEEVKEQPRGCIQIGEKIEKINADEDITLVDVETQVDMDAELQGRIDQDVSAATKDVSATEPTVFDDEEVTMTMAQTLIKMKPEKAKLIDEQIAKRLHDDKIEKTAARDKKEKDDLERAQKSILTISGSTNLKRKPVSIAQARKNMIIDLKNMAWYKMEHFRGMTYDKVRPIFEREYKKVQTLFKPDKDVEEPSKKRVAEEKLLQESDEDVQNMLEIILVPKFKVEALYVKYPIIDWEIYSESSRSYWKIIKVGGITEAYQSFEDMLKGFDKEDLVALWNLVKEKISSAVPNATLDESNLWNRRLGHIYLKTMNKLVKEKDYPLLNGVMTLMLSAKLQVEKDSEMARDLVMKIFMEANKPKSKNKLDWKNTEGDRYPFDLFKPLPLQGPPEVTYTTSIMKTKDARYEIKGIKSTAILIVKSVGVKKLHGYGHLEKIVVKRSDQQLYKFKEGDFVDLHLNDIEDMLLFTVQHKLFHLDGNVIVDFIMALRMFTRSLILKRRVGDLQLGVESYQKKLNITKPQKTFPKIEFKEPYTPSYDPP